MGGVRTAVWRTFRSRSTLHEAVKSKRGSVQGPVKKAQMACMSRMGAVGQTLENQPGFCDKKGPA